jgi:DNA helicase IV
MADDPVLSAERTILVETRGHVTRMIASAQTIADYGVDELASHALGRVRAERLRALRADPDAPPFFGRIDRDREADHAEPTAAGPAIEVFHIGRRHVRDEAGDPIVIDWRAPISRAFYRATPTDRMGVRLRRRFGFHGGELTSYEDEHLDLGEQLGLDSALLRAEIERPRVGPMRDIVATIQPDQDALVRADLRTSLCVQGAPGTGKTAVGLHRAAYLLYTYSEQLRRSGVLVIGPNRAFLHYIAAVLPSLGEVGIEQTSIAELIGADVATPATESAELATLKGDARLAGVLRRALLAQVAKPTEDVVALVGTLRYRVGTHRLRRYVDDARRSLADGVRWSDARERLRHQLAEDVRRQREDAGGAPSDAETARIARSVQVRAFVDAVWPETDAAALLGRLYAEPQFLARCAPELTGDERAALRRDAPRRRAAWTPADRVLLDELTALVDGTPSFGHVVVDEAQDLSAMQCRAVARRCPHGSMTVLGDLAQATTPWAPGDWAATLAALGQPDAELHPLTVGYRVPAEVLTLANRLLPHIAPGLAPATSVRAGVAAMRIVGRGDLAAQLRRCLAAPGSVGVIVPDAAVRSVLAELRAAVDDAAVDDAAVDGAAVDDAAVDDAAVDDMVALLDDERDERVTVVPATLAKGLEFDSVIVVEPAEMVAAEPTRAAGLRRLYVALTRAVSRLVVVHAEPLPAELRAAD